MKHFVFVIFLVLLAIWIQQSDRSGMIEISRKHIKIIRETELNPNLRLVLDKSMSLLSAFGQEFGLVPITILAIVFLPKGEVFIMFLMVTLSGIIWGVQKLYTKEPRPYFLENNKSASNVCNLDKEYGYPSGHSFTPATFHFVTLFCLLKNKIVTNKPFWSCFVAILVFAVMFSRLYKGVHSYD